MRWVVTGANRGIGLEMARQLSARGEVVIATARDPGAATELAKLAAGSDGRLTVHACDVGDDASVQGFASALGDVDVDVLVNNAGIMGASGSFESLDTRDMLHTLDVNALGPLRVTKALLARVLRSKHPRVVHITSGMGSIADNNSGGSYGYRMSKAALNMGNKSLSVDYARRGLIAVVMNPGWVQTDMGGASAPVSAKDSVRMMLARIDALEKKDNGTFLDYKGGTYPY